MNYIPTATRIRIKVADEVFIAVALLHREQANREDFTIDEIIERVAKENIFGEVRPGIQAHIYSHCVANRPPQPGPHRMLYATGSGSRRLVRVGDDVHPERTGKIFPDPDDVPPQYYELIEWAKQRYGKGTASQPRWLDGVFQMFGLGKELWRGEDPDEYVRNLREGWE